MKRRIALMLLLAGGLLAGLTPETVTLVYNRTDADELNTNAVYVSGTTLLFTNCVALVATGATQNLTDVFVVLRVGNEVTNYACLANVRNAAAGTFDGVCTIPTHRQMDVPVELDATVRLECTLTNAAGTSFTYRGSKLLTVRSKLSY